MGAGSHEYDEPLENFAIGQPLRYFKRLADRFAFSANESNAAVPIGLSLSFSLFPSWGNCRDQLRRLIDIAIARVMRISGNA